MPWFNHAEHQGTGRKFIQPTHRSLPLSYRTWDSTRGLVVALTFKPRQLRAKVLRDFLPQLQINSDLNLFSRTNLLPLYTVHHHDFFPISPPCVVALFSPPLLIPESIFTMSPPPTLRAPQLTPIPEHSPQLVAPKSSMKNFSPPNAMAAAVVLPAPGLPLTYYTDIPDEVPAIFSTSLQTQPKRKLIQPYPQSMTRTDLLGDVQRKVDSLWDRFPNEVRRVRHTENWYALYRYFDAVDLWVEGPAFCFTVIHRLATINLEKLEEKVAVISEYAQEWVQLHSKRLLTVAEHVPVWDLFTPEEIKDEEFDVMTDEEIATVKDQLEYHRHELLVKHQLAGPAAMAPIQPAQGMVGYQQQYPGQSPVYQRREYPHPEVAQPIVSMELSHSSVRTPQTYTNFMQNQRNIHGPPRDFPKDHRARGYSNVSDTNRGGRGGRGGNFRYNNVGQHQSARLSPQKQEPVYVLTGQRGPSLESTPRYHTGQRGSSLDLTSTRPDIPVPMRQRTVSGVITRPFFSNGARNRSPRRIVSEEVRTFSGHSRVISNSHAGVGHPKYHENEGRRSSNDARVPHGKFESPQSMISHSRVISNSSTAVGRPNYHASGDHQFSNDARVTQGIFGSPPTNTSHSRTISNSSASAGHSCYHGSGNQDSAIGSQRYVSPTRSNKAQPSFSKAEIDSIEYENGVGANGAVTIYYSGPRRALEFESTARTTYVWGVSRGLFLNNTLRNMMSECGDVDTISQLATAPQSFVAFHDERSVQRAIDRWDGEIVEGVTISVSAARPRNRDRGFSMSSGYRDGGLYRGHTRNTSQNTVFNGEVSANYGDFGFHHERSRNGSGNAMRNEQPVPYMPENALDQQGLHHIQPLAPLQEIQNGSLKSKNPAHTCYGMPSLNLKENLPLVTPRKNGTETPKKKGDQKKGSQQSSRQPTPPNSPRKFRGNKSTPQEILVGNNDKPLASAVSNRVPRHEHAVERPTSALAPPPERILEPNQGKPLGTQKQQSKPRTEVNDFTELVKDISLPAELVHSATNLSSGASRKKGKKAWTKKKPNFVKAGDNASFSTDTSSDTIISPLSNENVSFLTNPSTNTSLSPASSRQPSVARTKSRKTGYMGEKTELPLDFASEARKKGEQKVDTSMYETVKVPKVKNKSNRKSSKLANTAGEPGRQAKESGHSKKESISSSASNTSQRKADAVVKSDYRPTAITIPPPVIDAVAKNSSNLSTPIPTHATNATAKEDQPAPVASFPVIDPPKNLDAVETQPATSLSLLSPVKQLDEQEWPSLNPVKSPVAAIADGKPPNPLRAPLMGFLAKVVGEKSPEPKKAPRSIFPPVAVPRSFSGRSPS
ncbi:hypothetical protein BDZ45DRAFT_497050 [Acephala macrosclerotiorum]|nr:hypothetical protein BDZ45DRAFT_497050 [Acephala macrosclerotiorum]